MRNISLFVFLLVVSFVNNATAGAKADGVAFAEKWGVGKIDSYKCQASGSDYGWSSLSGKTDRKAQKELSAVIDSDGNGYGAVYYVATEMKDSGYKFCKYIFGAGRTNCLHNSWTGYWPADEQDCFWLCEKGYYGDSCDSKTFVATTLHDFSKDDSRKKWIDGKIHNLSVKNYRKHGNKEAEIPMFIYNEYIGCSGGTQIELKKMTKAQEHDVVLVAKGLVVGASKKDLKYTIQPMVVRAAGTKGCYSLGAAHTAWAFSKFVANERTDLCPGDLTLNDKGTCGIPEHAEQSAKETAALEAAMNKAKSLEEQGLAILCQNWPKEKYDNKIHELKAATFEYSNWRVMPADYEKSGDNKNWTYGDATATCTIFRCKDSKGYAKDPTVSGDFTCVDCSVSTDTTVHPSRLGTGKEGVCKVCPVGEIVVDGICIKAKQIHKNSMAGNLLEKDVSKQCWTQATPDEYKTCLMDNNLANFKTAASVESEEIQAMILSVPSANQSELIKQYEAFKSSGMAEEEIKKQIKALVDFYN